MSDFGVLIRDKYGRVSVDLSSVLIRHLYNIVVPSTTTSGDTTLDDLSGKESVEIAISVNPETSTDYSKWQRSVPHEVSRSGNVISWTKFSGSGLALFNDSVIQVFTH